MRHQRGYVFEKSGAFHVRFWVTENGERKQKSHRLCTKDRHSGCGSATAHAVQQACEDFMRTIRGPVAPGEAQTPMKVTEFWDSVYLPFVTTNLKHSTVVGYTQTFEGHLRQHFGTMTLREYRTPMMTNHITALAKTYRPRTLKAIKNITSGMFSHAVATGHCETNPIRDAAVLGKMLPNGVTQSYSLEEIENIITALVDHADCQLVMALSFFLGLRKSEIAGLQWSDFDGDYVHIRRACVRGHVDVPKTLKSVRSLPLIQPVRGLLMLWKQRCGDGAVLWVFPSDRGKTTNLDRLAAEVIRPTLREAGCEWKGFHAGRRGLGTTLRALTGNSNAGRDVLGHSTTQVTEVHYEAAMPEEALKGMRLLEEKASK